MSHALGSKDSSLHSCSSATSTSFICPRGWIDTGDIGMGCLLFSDFQTDWFNAYKYCQAKQSHLFEVESRTEFEYMREMQANKNINQLWAGGTDAFKEGEWIWSNSGKQVGQFLWKTWESGNDEPNAILGENCMEMRATYGGFFNDNQCHFEFHFVCQK